MVFGELVNNTVLEKNFLVSAQKEFLSGKPFPHIRIENFLKESVANRLLREIKKEAFTEKESDLFYFKQTDDLYFSQNAFVKEFNTAFLDWEFFSFVSAITGVKFKGTLDMSATLYESCAFLLPHDDELEGRKIAYLLYLSKGFSATDGGSFALYNTKNKKPVKIVKRYPPTFNSLLMFEVSDISFHEVEENLSRKKRYAVGGWLH